MFTEYVNELKDAVARGEMHVNSALDKLHAEFMAFVNKVQMPAVTEPAPEVPVAAPTEPAGDPAQVVTQDPHPEDHPEV
jgi:hypothetical protein